MHTITLHTIRQSIRPLSRSALIHPRYLSSIPPAPNSTPPTSSSDNLPNPNVSQSLATHFSPSPSPPRLPPSEQAEFERLQKLAFSEPSPETESEGGAIHPNIRRGAPAEFDGDVNPKTGEVGGPKTDPLRWKNEWAFNGRVTDF